MIYIGIDPGQSGGIACYISKTEILTYPLKETTLMDIFEYLEDVRKQETSGEIFAMLENVHSMPKQGVASSFKFGRNFGNLEGLLTGSKIPFDYVTPQKWQKELGCLSHGDKNVTKSKAQRLFPHLKIPFL